MPKVLKAAAMFCSKLSHWPGQGDSAEHRDGWHWHAAQWQKTMHLAKGSLRQRSARLDSRPYRTADLFLDLLQLEDDGSQLAAELPEAAWACA